MLIELCISWGVSGGGLRDTYFSKMLISSISHPELVDFHIHFCPTTELVWPEVLLCLLHITGCPHLSGTV